MTQIAQKTNAERALHWLGEARDDLLLVSRDDRTIRTTRYELAIEALGNAAKELGFALTPIPKPEPADGGRLHHNEPEPACGEGAI